MARTKRADLIQEPETVSFSEDEYLKHPEIALAEVSSGRRVEVLAENGTPCLVIYPGTIADIVLRD